VHKGSWAVGRAGYTFRSSKDGERHGLSSLQARTLVVARMYDVFEAEGR